MKPYSVKFLNLILVLVISFLVLDCHCTHIKGTWKTSDFFKFIVKFGVQKTDLRFKKDTLGYIFGNITSKSSLKHNATLAILDRAYFLEYYGNRTLKDKDLACKKMFSKVKEIAYDPVCFNEGEDFLRKVPCLKDKLCYEEDYPWEVVKGSQFTFHVEDLKEPRFWYLSLVACYRNTTNGNSSDNCDFHHIEEEAELEYDIWLVNGDPNASSYNPLIYQFSFDRQNTMLLYLLFFLCYLVLVPLQMYAVTCQHHPVTRLFTASLLLEFVGLMFNVIDVVKYSVDGIGTPNLAIAGDVLDILSRTTFMLILLLLAKGWAVTRMELTSKPLLFSIWVVYGVVHILLYVWNRWEVDIVEEIDEYQTWPGWLILVLRSVIMVWFLYELRTTMLYEHNDAKLHFFLHFGASALVWYIYLPVVALIALQVPPFWRYKLLLGITYSADCLAYCSMTHLLWPTRSQQYFLLAHTLDPSDELDEFNEAPHVLHSGYTSLRNSINSGSAQDLTFTIENAGSTSDLTSLEYTKLVM